MLRMHIINDLNYLQHETCLTKECLIIISVPVKLTDNCFFLFELGFNLLTVETSNYRSTIKLNHLINKV